MTADVHVKDDPSSNDIYIAKRALQVVIRNKVFQSKMIITYAKLA